ncbi:hypothetical protein [Bdellovibrio sp. HCB274]|uniref:hypothetical protein n=1 Tax=Bdellovibrio sp. HCB274 TaxID=3394361 RepID=UPI0039B6B372
MNRYLRIAGILLLLSPFLNFFISVAMLPASPSKWTWAYLSAMYLAATPMQWALRISKIVVGYLMFRAKSSAWLPVLVILAVTIAYNFLTFSKDWRTSSTQTVLSLLINFALFGMVLRAEILVNRELNEKLQAARAAKAAAKTTLAAMPTAATVPHTALENAPEQFPKEASVVQLFPDNESPVSSESPPPETIVEFAITKGSAIDFEGVGQFAEVVRCQEDEIWIKGLTESPSGLTTRPVILESTESGASICLHYDRHDSDDVLVFKIA